MANINFNELEAINNQNNAANELPGFFTLSGDGDEAIVRFMHDSTDSFDIISTHSITVNGKFRNVNCIRNPKEPLDRCPLCARGDRINNRIYIHLVEYVIDPSTNQVVPKLRVWDRSLSYAQTLKNYLDNYGPLSDMICKIIRHGARGSMQTTYEIVPNLNKQIYPDNVYVKPVGAFENYTALGTAVANKSYEDLQFFVQNGTFPEPSNNNYSTVEPVKPMTAPPQFPNSIPVAEPYVAPQLSPSYTPAGNDFPPTQVIQPQLSPTTNPYGNPAVVTPYTGTPNSAAVPPAVTPVIQKPVRYN